MVVVSVLILFTYYIASSGDSNTIKSDNLTEQTKIQDATNTEPTYAFHGFHVTIHNVSECDSWLYPQNSTLNDLAGSGYDIIEITHEDIEKYSYLKDGLKPGAPNGEFTRALEDEEKDEFFEKFYGKCFNYGGHNYVINMFKN